MDVSKQFFNDSGDMVLSLLHDDNFYGNKRINITTGVTLICTEIDKLTAINNQDMRGNSKYKLVIDTGDGTKITSLLTKEAYLYLTTELHVKYRKACPHHENNKIINALDLLMTGRSCDHFMALTYITSLLKSDSDIEGAKELQELLDDIGSEKKREKAICVLQKLAYKE